MDKKYKNIKQYNITESNSDLLNEAQMSFAFNEPFTNKSKKKILSLFSGCGGMDLGFEGGFVANKKSFGENSPFIKNHLNNDWVLLKQTDFKLVFANDILKDARTAWLNYMRRFGYGEDVYVEQSVVDLVKMHNYGAKVFPENIDIVTGGFPCQDFSVAGKRKGFKSNKNHLGEIIESEESSEETRGKLYYWMKQVIDITKPKIFVAENVKGLVNLGNVRDIIRRDFESAGGNGYIVLNPKVLHAGNYGVPESRERVIFIGISKKDLLPEALEALSRDEIPPEYNPYPAPTHSYNVDNDKLLPFVTVRDVLENLEEPENTVDESQKKYSRAKYMSKGQGQTEVDLDNLGPTIRSEHHGNIEFRRLSKEHGGHNMDELSRGLLERRLTPRECALIQTFPPDYQFVIKKKTERGYRLSPSGAYRIIGNAVPPVLAYKIATRIQELWPKYFGK